MSSILPAGDADLDGKVSASDLALVTANLGKTGAWWEDGDFNHDGVVGQDDLDIVYGQLNLIADGGFEQVSLGAGQFQYRPTGSPWTFSGTAGISANNSGFTSGNPAAPDGAQVAFLQRTGSFSQTVSNWAAGSYVLTFDAAQRGNFRTSRQDFRVLVDGVVVGSFTPSGTSYQSFSTPVFNVTAGSHTITFQGLNSAGGDNTVFIDGIARINKSLMTDGGFEQVQVGAGQFQYEGVVPMDDGGFEQVQVGAGKFQYRPTGSPWTFSGNAGISANKSGFTSGNPAAPDGAQVAFLQRNRLVQPVRQQLGGRLLRPDLRRRPARQLPGAPGRTSGCWLTESWSAPSPPRAPRTRVSPPRVQRHRRVAHDHLPGIE